jgi:hypothetical protein
MKFPKETWKLVYTNHRPLNKIKNTDSREIKIQLKNMWNTHEIYVRGKNKEKIEN